MKLIFATGNRGKLREAQEILGEGFTLVTPADMGITEEIPETGSTLEENSLQKAEYLSGRAKDVPGCFADDTGLEVNALGGAPGVYTARYASLRGRAGNGDHDFEANMDTLLAELQNSTDRRARFRSIVTLMLGGQTHVFEGVLQGRIATAKAGCGGFGYDPVFIANGMQCTLAEISEEAKNAISHRGKALRAMAAWLQEHHGK
ncbi:MAG: RdgB/HAM1 family non-canonical purine NTP pyrophosphatase [Bacteroidales bacterium]|nr:RdgB/HAM1 family non-canonical purine NTP pyrophosphatase [Bacteroidales bacterium]